MMNCRGAWSVDSRWAAGVQEGSCPLSAAEHPGILPTEVPRIHFEKLQVFSREDGWSKS